MTIVEDQMNGWQVLENRVQRYPVDVYDRERH